MEQQEKEPKRFWGLIELMGHAKIAGQISEEEFGGTKLIRVDVPEMPERTDMLFGRERTIPATAPFTKYIGGAAVYSMTPLSREACLRVIQRFEHVPVQAVDLTVTVVEPAQIPASIDGGDWQNRLASASRYGQSVESGNDDVNPDDPDDDIF